MSTTTEKDVESLVAEMKQLRGDFAKLGELLQKTIRHAGEEAAREAAAAGERAWTGAKVKADEFAQSVQEEPLLYTAGAFGIGMLLGILFGSRR
ncbi:MAG TPA: hypothetical protein VN932_02070 [Rhizomicrobium sp.]|nr:hypothetical protein [Rhizomicrobium sp.]